MGREPTFVIGVGATKAGTSWLFTQLAAHPDCHLRTIKELHYFDTMQAEATDRVMNALDRSKDRLRGRIPAASPERRTRLRRRLGDLRKWREVLALKQENLAAYRGYLLAGRGSRRVVGEVTPAYATLSAAALHRIANLAEDVRLVYVMRDPVARFWSHVRMLALREDRDPANFEVTVNAKFEQVIATDPLFGERGDYIAALAKLRQVVAPDRLLVMFNEELTTPAGVAKLWDYLAVTPVTVDFDRRVHEGRPMAMTPEQRARARAALLPQYDLVIRTFPTVPEAWMRSMEEVAA